MDENSFLKRKINQNISNKNRQINRKKESLNDIFTKTKEIQLQKYILNMKNERYVSLKEAYQNKIENLNDQINEIHRFYDLFNDQFFVKFNEYIKFLQTKREIEKKKNEKLDDDIFNLRNDIMNVEAKVKKIEYKRNIILRWIYLFIMIHEKITVIPSYYKLIIEEPEITFKNMIMENNEMNKNLEKRDSKASLYDRRESRESTIENLFNINLNDSGKKNPKKFNEIFKIKRKYTRKNLPQNYHNFVNLFKQVTQEEINRVRNYKYELIFKTPQEFFEKINKFETIDLNLMDDYNRLRLKIKEINKERDIEKKLFISEKELVIKNLKAKEKEIISVKNKYNLLLNEVNTLKKNLNKKTTKRAKTAKSRLFSYDNFKKEKLSKVKLHSKVLELYNNVQLIDYTQVINPNFLSQRKDGIFENQIVVMLKQIELVFYFLINKYKYYKSNKCYEKPLKMVIKKIENLHQMERTKNQKEAESERIRLLNEGVMNRFNKIYFLPRKREDKFSKKAFHKEKQVNKQEEEIREPVFEDFMYDVYDKNDNSF